MQVHIDRMDHFGNGIGNINGKIIFVKGYLYSVGHFDLKRIHFLAYLMHSEHYGTELETVLIVQKERECPHE